MERLRKVQRKFQSESPLSGSEWEAVRVRRDAEQLQGRVRLRRRVERVLRDW